MAGGWYWQTLVQLALPLVDDYSNVWRGILFGLMEATVPKDVANLVEEAFEAEHHLRSGSIVILDGRKKGGGKRAGRKRRSKAAIHKEPLWPWEGF